MDARKSVAKASQLSRGVVKTVAGMAVTNPREFIQLAAHNGDLLLKGDFSQATHDTYAFFVNKGTIDPKYFDTTEFADLAPEFAEVRDGKFGVYKLDQIRKIFVNLAKDSGKDSHKKYLLDIALGMSEPEIKVMLADRHLDIVEAPKHEANYYRQTGNWRTGIVDASGLVHDNLVDIAWKQLAEKGLMRWAFSSGMDFLPGSGNLTSMGLELCELTQLDDDPISV